MKARIIPKKPPPDNRTPEEKAKDSRKAKELLATLALIKSIFKSEY